MKTPKIHLYEKKSKKIVITLTIIAFISLVLRLLDILVFRPLAFHTTLLFEFIRTENKLLPDTILLAAVVLFALFLIKLHKNRKTSHCVFAAVLLLFGLHFGIYFIIDAPYTHYYLRFSIYQVYDWLNMFCYLCVAVLCMVSAIAIYKKENMTKFQKKSLPTIALFSLFIFLNEVSYNTVHDNYIVCLSSMLYLMAYPCVAIALNIYHKCNPPIPKTPINPKEFAPVEALRILKEQFTAGIIDEETYARLRGEALKKL